MTKILTSAATVLTLTLAATTVASAKPQNLSMPPHKPGPHLPGPGYGKPMVFAPAPHKPGPFKPGPGYGKPYGEHYGYGGVAAGLVGGLALGAIAASAAQPVAAEGECYTVRRRFVDAYGDVVVRRVEVCE